MNTWIALFRGINVGGNHMLPMKSLLAILEGCGCSEARTYIQSGNAVFRSSSSSAETLAARIGRAVLKAHGFEPRVLVLSAKELKRAMDRNPFSAAEAEPKTLHLFFLTAAPRKTSLALLDEVKADESFKLDGGVFYLHTPSGLARSKVAVRIDRALGVESTARNWRTCQKVLELAAAAD